MDSTITGKGQWQIYTSAATIPHTSIGIGSAYHNYIALVNPAGQVVAEFNGTYSGSTFTATATPGNYLTAGVGPVGTASAVTGTSVVFAQPVDENRSADTWT